MSGTSVGALMKFSSSHDCRPIVPAAPKADGLSHSTVTDTNAMDIPGADIFDEVQVIIVSSIKIMLIWLSGKYPCCIQAACIYIAFDLQR